MSTTSLQSVRLKWFIVVIFLLLAILFFGIGSILYPLPWQSASWPHTQGIISGYTLIETRTRGSHFDAVATYQYEVGGQGYKGNDAVFPLNGHHRRDSIDRMEAEKRAEALQLIGKNVRVFYDPDTPSRSTLQPGMQSSIITFFLFGGVCLLVAISQAWTLRSKYHYPSNWC